MCIRLAMIMTRCAPNALLHRHVYIKYVWMYRQYAREHWGEEIYLQNLGSLAGFSKVTHPSIKVCFPDLPPPASIFSSVSTCGIYSLSPCHLPPVQHRSFPALLTISQGLLPSKGNVHFSIQSSHHHSDCSVSVIPGASLAWLSKAQLLQSWEERVRAPVQVCRRLDYQCRH